MTQALAQAARKAGRLGGMLAAWDPEEHPRDRFGKFRNKWKLSPAAQAQARRVLDRFSPATFRSDEHAQSFLDTVSKRGKKRSPRQEASLEYFRTSKGFDDIQSALDASAGEDLPQVRDLDQAMEPLPNDMLLTSVVGLDAFGLTPDRVGELEEWTGKLVMDKRYRSMNLGSPYQVAGPHVTISAIVPRGTRAIVPGNSREVILDREQPLRLMKIQPDGRGGAYAYAIAMPKSGTGEAPRGLGKELTPLEKGQGQAASPRVTAGPRPTPGPIEEPTPGPEAVPGAPAPSAEAPETPSIPESPTAPEPTPLPKAPEPATVATPEAKPQAPRPTEAAPPVPGPLPSPRRLTPAQRKAFDEKVVARAKARERQQQMARSESVAAAGAKADELIGKNADDSAIARHLRAEAMSPRMAGIRDLKEQEKLASELEEIATEFDKGNRSEGQRRIAKMLRANRVELEGGAGRVVDFDEALHDAPAEPYPPGTKVKVIRPGSRFVRDDGDVVHLSKPQVVMASPEGRAPRASGVAPRVTTELPQSPTPGPEVPDLRQYRLASTPAQGALRGAQRDLDRGEDPEEVADDLRRQADELAEGEGLSEDDIPDRIGRSREELGDVARADANTLRQAADALEESAIPPELRARMEEAEGARGPGTVPGRRPEATGQPPGQGQATAAAPSAATSGTRAIAPGDPRYVDAREVGEGLNLRDEDERMLRSVQDDLDGGEGPGNAPKTPAAVGRLLEQRAKGPAGPYYRAAVITGVEDWKRRLADADRPGSPWTREQAQRGLAETEARVSALRAQGDRWIALAERLKKTRRPAARKAALARVAGGPAAGRPAPEAREVAPPVPAPGLGRDLDKLLKADLLQLARNEGVTEVRDGWTKDRIKGAILSRRRGETPKAPAARKAVPAKKAVTPAVPKPIRRNQLQDGDVLMWEPGNGPSKRGRVVRGDKRGQLWVDWEGGRREPVRGPTLDAEVRRATDEEAKDLPSGRITLPEPVREAPGKAARAVRQSPTAVADRLKDATSPDEARGHLDGLTNDELRAVARAVGAPVGSKDVKDVLKKKITDQVPARKAVPAPRQSAGAAAGKLRMTDIRPGDRILVRRSGDTWVPATRKTDATEITVNEVNPVTGRGGKRQVVGTDPDGNQVKVEPRAGVQTFFTGKAAPARIAEQGPVATEGPIVTRGAAPSAPAPKKLATEEQSRARRVEIDTASSVARLLSYYHELQDNETSPEVIKRNVATRAKVLGTPGDVVGQLLSAGDIDSIAKKNNLIRDDVGVVTFDPKRNKVLDEWSRDDVGRLMRVFHPGYRYKDKEGKEVRVSESIGELLTEKEAREYKAGKLAPAKVAAPRQGAEAATDKIRITDVKPGDKILVTRGTSKAAGSPAPWIQADKKAGATEITVNEVNPIAGRGGRRVAGTDPDGSQVRLELRAGTRALLAAKKAPAPIPATAPPLTRARPRYDSESGPPLARPNADEPIFMPRLAMSGSGSMHADSSMGKLWNALYQDDRVPNSVLNRIMRAGLSMATGDRSFDDILKRLRQLETEMDPVVAARIRQTVDTIDAPKVGIPELPPTVPKKVVDALQKLAGIPTARRSGRVGAMGDTDRSILSKKLAAVQRIEAGERGRGDDDPRQELTRHDLHESIEGAVQMWKLFDGFVGDPEIRRWVQEAARRKESPPKADATAKAVATPGKVPSLEPKARTVFGDEVRGSIASATTPQEVAQAVANEASKIAGDDVRVDLTGAGLDVAKSFGEGILRGMERYPTSPLREIGTYGRGRTDGVSGTHNARMAAWDTGAGKAYAVTIRGGETNGAGGVYEGGDARLPGGTTTAGTAVYLNVDTGRRAWEDLAVTGRLAQEGLIDRQQVSTTPLGVALHESAHSVAGHGRPRRPEDAVGQRARELAGGRDIRRFVAGNVSVYATTSDAELAAEVVADVELNGVDGVNDVTRQLFEAFEVNARGWEQEVTR
jgi:hypothetical protein